MSYGLDLFVPINGKSLKESLVELQGAHAIEVLSISDLSRIRIEAGKLMQALVCEYSEFEKWVELTAVKTDFQITFFAGKQAGISAPYGRNDLSTRATFSDVITALQILNKEFGYVVYDPQLSQYVELFDTKYLHHMLQAVGCTNSTISDLWKHYFL